MKVKHQPAGNGKEGMGMLMAVVLASRKQVPWLLGWSPEGIRLP